MKSSTKSPRDDFSDEKEVDWTVDCLIDYVETSNVQFSQEKHDKYEKHDKHIDDDRPFRVTLKAADENSALYKDRMSGSAKRMSSTSILEVKSDSAPPVQTRERLERTR